MTQTNQVMFWKRADHTGYVNTMRMDSACESKYCRYTLSLQWCFYNKTNLMH